MNSIFYRHGRIKATAGSSEKLVSLGQNVRHYSVVIFCMPKFTLHGVGFKCVEKSSLSDPSVQNVVH
jgi:hypothetical protein